MTTLDQTAFKQLEAENRLFNPVFKGSTDTPGRFGFRGEIAIKFSPQFADEARPPEITADQVIAIAQEGEAGLGYLSAFLLSFVYLKPLAEALDGVLMPEGKYFLFCDNIDLSKRYQVTYNGATFYILPISEATVYNEMLELLYLERNDLKRLKTAGKVDKVADKALSFSETFPAISYEEGLALMGPVRDPGENRPV